MKLKLFNSSTNTHHEHEVTSFPIYIKNGVVVDKISNLERVELFLTKTHTRIDEENGNKSYWEYKQYGNVIKILKGDLLSCKYGSDCDYHCESCDKIK